MSGGKHRRKPEGFRGRGLTIALAVIFVLAACLVGVVALGGGFGKNGDSFSSGGSHVSAEDASETSRCVSGAVVECEDGCAISLSEKMVFIGADGSSYEADTLYFAEGASGNVVSCVGYPVKAEVSISLVEEGRVYVTPLSVELEMFDIAMKYGSFKYPARWIDSVVMEERMDGNCLAYSFYATDFEDRIPLFSITYSAEGAEGVVGVIEVDGEELFVCASQADVPEGFSESEVSQFRAMLDDMNYLIAGVAYADGVKLVA